MFPNMILWYQLSQRNMRQFSTIICEVDFPAFLAGRQMDCTLDSLLDFLFFHTKVVTLWTPIKEKLAAKCRGRGIRGESWSILSQINKPVNKYVLEFMKMKLFYETNFLPLFKTVSLFLLITVLFTFIAVIKYQH